MRGFDAAQHVAEPRILTNTQLPIDRGIGANEDLTLIGSGKGFHPTDFAKADIDVDGILAVTQGVILGLSGGIPLLVSYEGNLLDLDLGAFFGVGQTMDFLPLLDATLAFSSPVSIETSPGVFTDLTSYHIGVGDSLSFVHPGGDLMISPTYELDNTFNNFTSLMISPVITLQVLQMKVSGLASGLMGNNFDAALVHHVFPLGDPMAAAQLGNTEPFKLGGFQTIRGTDLVLGTAPAPVPEPAMMALLALGLGAVARWRRRPARARGGS